MFEPKWDGFRCIIFRDGDEVELGQPQRDARSLATSPRSSRPRRPIAARALRRRRRGHRRHRRPARVRAAARADPPGRVPGADAGREDPGGVRRLRPAGPRRRVAARCAVRASAGRSSSRHSPTRKPPIYLTSATTDLDHGRGLVRDVRGRWTRRRRRQADDRHLPAQRPGDDQGQARPHGGRRRRGLPLPQDLDRREATARLAPPRPVRRRRQAAARRSLGGVPRRPAS